MLRDAVLRWCFLGTFPCVGRLWWVLGATRGQVALTPARATGLGASACFVFTGRGWDAQGAGPKSPPQLEHGGQFSGGTEPPRQPLEVVVTNVLAIAPVGLWDLHPPRVHSDHGP